MNSFLCFLLCIYAFLKFLFGYTANNNFQQYEDTKRYILRSIFIVLTLTITLLVTTCFLLPFYILHHSVDVYLRIKLGSAYGGMLKGQDSGLQAIKHKALIRGVFILNENKDCPDIWRSCLANARTLHLSSYKVSSTIQNCLGYHYYLKDQIKFDDVVDKGQIGDKEYITKEEFLEYLNSLCHTSAEERLWYFTYFPQPILWNNKGKKSKQYAFIVSFQHSLSDGPNALKHLIKYFMDDSYKTPQSNSLDTLKNRPELSIDDAYIVENPFYKCQEGFPKINETKNDVQEPYLAISSEDTEKYLGLIKKVKTKLGVGFTSIAMDALSNSLRDFLKMKQKPLRDVVFVSTIRPEEINLVFKSNTKDPLVNDVGHQIIKIPAKQATLGIEERLQYINESLKQVRRSVDSTMTYICTNFAHFVPSSIQRTIINISSFGITSVITNMSGMKTLIFDGHNVEAAFFFISHAQDIGFTFCIMSLDGKLQLSLSSSAKYVSSREELQDILEGTLRYIDKFAEELEVLQM